MITDRQVVLMRQKLMKGKTQQAAAAASGMSERSVRNWSKGSLPSEKKKDRRRQHPGRFGASHLRTLQRRMRDWRDNNFCRRTRPDPLWEQDIEPLLRPSREC